MAQQMRQKLPSRHIHNLFWATQWRPLMPQQGSDEQRQHDSDHWSCRPFSLGVKVLLDGQAPIHDWDD
jgi:hypothetical protein